MLNLCSHAVGGARKSPVSSESPANRFLQPPLETVRKLTLTISAIVVFLSSSLAWASLPKAQPAYQDLASIAQVVRHTVKSMPEVAALRNVKIDLQRLNQQMRLYACSLPIEAFPPAKGVGSGRFSVRVRCDGARPWSVYITVTVQSEVSVVTTRRSLPRGHIITAGDVITRRVLRSPIRQSVIRSSHEAEGMALKRAVGSGVELSVALLKKPQIIKTGEQALITVSSQGLNVRVTGKALQHGAVGDTIRVLNLSSKKTIYGRVEPDGSISVVR